VGTCREAQWGDERTTFGSLSGRAYDNSKIKIVKI
jgi:hypothetical protein